MKPVNNAPAADIHNRAAEILRVLPPADTAFALLPTTGDVVRLLGLSVTNANMASVSRSLDRLRRRGLVLAFHSMLMARGKGSRWASATPPGPPHMPVYEGDEGAPHS